MKSITIEWKETKEAIIAQVERIKQSHIDSVLRIKEECGQKTKQISLKNDIYEINIFTAWSSGFGINIYRKNSISSLINVEKFSVGSHWELTLKEAKECLSFLLSVTDTQIRHELEKTL